MSLDTMTTMPAAEVYELRANDIKEFACTVREAGPALERWHETWNDKHNRPFAWWKGHRDSGHETWSEYIDSLADILRDAEVWPFPPIEVSRSRNALYDGHHRTQAALRAGWDKPIAVQFS